MSDQSGEAEGTVLSLKTQLAVPLHWLLACAALAVVVNDWPLGTVLDALHHRGAAAHLAARFSLLVALAPFLWWTYRLNRRLYHRLSNSRQARDAEVIESVPSPEQLIHRIRGVVERYDPAALAFFATTLVLPRTNIVRAVEEARLEEHMLTLHTSLTIDVTRLHPSVSGAPSLYRRMAWSNNNVPSCPTLVVPLLRAKKGALIDNFDTESAGTASLPTLSQSETKDLIAYVVASLFWGAYIDPKRRFTPEALIDQQLKAARKNGFDEQSAPSALAVLLRTIYSHGPVDMSILTGAKEILDTIGAKNSRLEAYLWGNLDFLASSYIVAAEVPRPEGTHLNVKYRKSLPLYSQTASRVNLWRLRLGLRPDRFTIPIWLPFTVGSYHFKMISSPGQFVHDFSLVEVEDKPGNTRTHTTDTLREKRRQEKQTAGEQTTETSTAESTHRLGTAQQPLLRTHQERGLVYAHLYAVGFRFREFFNIAMVVRFAEIPPGALGGTAVIALVSAVLITFFALLGQPRQGQGVGVAVLLSAPTIAASILGFAAHEDSLLRSSLTARLGLIFAGFLSLSATLLYVAQSIGVLTKPQWRAGLLGGKVHVTMSPWWLILSVLSLGWAAHMCWMLMMRTHAYMNQVRAGDKPVNQAFENGSDELNENLDKTPKYGHSLTKHDAKEASDAASN